MRFFAAARASSRREISPCKPSFEPASLCSPAIRDSNSLIGFSNSRITCETSRQEPQKPLQILLERQTVHDSVHEAVLALELGGLEALGQPLLGGLLDHPRPREPYPGLRLGDDYVRGGCERGRHPPEGRVCKDRDVGPRAVHVARE